jgi:hypothetical protein
MKSRLEIKSHRAGLFLAGLLFAASIQPVFAHDPGLSTATITVRPNEVEIALGMSTVDAKWLAGPTAVAEPNLDANQLVQKLTPLAAKWVELVIDGSSARATDIRGSADANNVTLTLGFHGKPSRNISFRSVLISQMPRGHRELTAIQNPGGEILASRLLSAETDSITAGLKSGGDIAQTSSNSFRDFLGMGIMHIWTGYDHLLFLFGLLVVTRKFGSALKIISCFTLAHSLTLALATLDVVRIPSRIVEPLIAASIVFVGVENFLRGGEPKGRYLLALGFGLIHGFGFASALREVGVGANGGGIVIPLVSFNLGVEVGQLVIAAVALPLIWKLRARPQFDPRWVPACSTMVALLGAWWFVQRVWL